jgi:hypothetical protein
MIVGMYERTGHFPQRKLVLLPLLLLLIGCNRNAGHATDSVTADVIMDARVATGNRLTGKLYLSNGRLRVDWGVFADVFDLKKRTGWRILESSKTYMDLADKDLSTFAPEMTNGALCPHTQVPSACKLVGKEEVNGRVSNKWDVWNPRGFHVYYWTDDKLAITLRCEIGETTYEAKNLRNAPLRDAIFELPAGYERADRPWKP